MRALALGLNIAFHDHLLQDRERAAGLTARDVTIHVTRRALADQRFGAGRGVG
jgi:hypothetical protein